MYYYDAGLMPLESRLKKMIDILFPNSIILHKGKVSLENFSIFYKLNIALQKDPKEKVIGNIYEITPAVRNFLSNFIGANAKVIDGLEVQMPSFRENTKEKGYTNIKNIPNFKWKYEPEDKIQAPEL